MNKKIIIFLVAIFCALIFIAPIMAGDNQLDVDNLVILKNTTVHTDSDGNVDKHTDSYLKFKVASKDNMGNYTVDIDCFNKNGDKIDTIHSYVDHDGKFKIPLSKVSGVKKVNVTIKDGDKVLFNKATSHIKNVKHETSDKPKASEESSGSSVSSSSSSGQTYWASANSDKFHYPSCEWAQKISGSNKIVFSSRDEALNSGYQPCQVCSP